MYHIRQNFVTHTKFIKYLMSSGFVAVVDVILVWILMKYFNIELVYANTVGVVCGFLLHYMISARAVFQTHYNWMGFLIYVGTFIVGLFLTGFLLVLAYQHLFNFLRGELNFLVSKSFATVIPFFILYFTRKYLYQIIDKKEERYEKEVSL